MKSSENFSARYPNGRSQHFTFPRRELLQKVVSVALLFAIKPATEPAKPVAESVEKDYPYPAPAFSIGDKIRSPWLDEDLDDEDAEGEEVEDELGEVMGVCWHPRRHCWEYLVNWTGGSASEICYPCFDENMISGNDLRLVTDV
ncbi:hypothetical protein QUA56_27130 [Microcoleus sp. N3A4]|uniref:hypothetical protein n=1 Tax=Microcoleus sp. N3A4 TaxID=3055379 RepID=UPI002FCEDD68